jgi:hypothetical protein
MTKRTNEKMKLLSFKHEKHYLSVEEAQNIFRFGYRNVSLIKGKWVVQLQIDGKNTKLGSFDDVHEAGKFAEEMRQKYYGEFAGKN